MIGLKRGTVQLVQYDPIWKEMIEKEKKLLKSVLSDSVIAIEHIGSTSIPGIVAKPIIDISIGMKSVGDVKHVIRPLESIMYEWRQEFDDPTKQLLFVKGSEEERTHYVHVMKYNGSTWKNDLLFRDYLKNNPKWVLRYEQLKRELATKYSNNRELYTKNKPNFILQVLAVAKQIQ